MALWRGKVIAPPEVLVEVVGRKSSSHEDAAFIAKAIQDGWLEEMKLHRVQESEVDGLLRSFGDISRADAAAIITARVAGIPVCLDDSRAVKVAQLMNVEHLGTIGVILLATRKGLVRKEEASEFALALPKRGFYLEHDLLAAFLEELEGI
jgi:predicted nucleic acid-binding protein